MNLEHLNEAQLSQLEASLTRAVKGVLCMHSKCSDCERAKCLFEKILPDGSIRHECKSCGYFMIWTKRTPWTRAKRKDDREYQERTFGPAGINADR